MPLLPCRMHPFLRVLKITLRHYYALGGIFLSSAIVALLWGANIGTLYPMVEIVFKGDSVSQYVDQQIVAVQAKVVEDREAVRSKAAKLAAIDPSDSDAIAHRQSKLSSAKTALAVTQRKLQSYRTAKPYVDRYAPSTPFRTLAVIVALLVGGTGIKLMALGSNLLLVQYIAQKTVLQIRKDYFRKALQLDLDRFGENGSADLTSRLTNDVGGIGGGITVLLGRLIREPLKMMVCFTGAMMICPRLLLLVMIVTPLLAVLMNRLSRMIRRASRKAMEEMSAIYGMLTDAFAGIRVVRAFNTQAHQRRQVSSSDFGVLWPQHEDRVLQHVGAFDERIFGDDNRRFGDPRRRILGGQPGNASVGFTNDVQPVVDQRDPSVFRVADWDIRSGSEIVRCMERFAGRHRGLAPNLRNHGRRSPGARSGQAGHGRAAAPRNMPEGCRLSILPPDRRFCPGSTCGFVTAKRSRWWDPMAVANRRWSICCADSTIRNRAALRSMARR